MGLEPTMRFPSPEYKSGPFPIPVRAASVSGPERIELPFPGRNQASYHLDDRSISGALWMPQGFLTVPERVDDRKGKLYFFRIQVVKESARPQGAKELPGGFEPAYKPVLQTGPRPTWIGNTFLFKESCGTQN